jgi:magnesium-protoporphyrin O-methyltransferase
VLQVVAIDLSPTLVDLARERIPADVAHLVEFYSGDMLDKGLGHFDHVVAMDSIIHYDTEDAVNALAQLAERTSQSIVFTFAPRTPMLALMISVGRLLPRGDRAPWLEPMAETRIAQLMKTHDNIERLAMRHEVTKFQVVFINLKRWSGFAHESQDFFQVCQAACLRHGCRLPT